ncbi:Nn.00g021200.m01.CDS01 [Neocucurbitaria sp. VM-36]
MGFNALLSTASNTSRHANQATGINVVPNPKKRMSMSYMNMRLDIPAPLHTILSLVPDAALEDRNTNSSKEMEPDIRVLLHEDGRVSDATFPQFGYDRNCHRMQDYLRDKAIGRRTWVLRLGYCFVLHLKSMEREANSLWDIHAHVRDAAILTTNTTVCQEVGKLGGRKEFIALSSHDVFMNNRQRLVDTVRTGLKGLRADVDKVYLAPTPVLNKRAALLGVICERRSSGHYEIMSAYLDACGIPKPN